jgi:UDP-N-acetylmuramoyl-tripeptide--D-alanyl-D-alanine ligase
MEKFLWDNESLKKACPGATVGLACHGNTVCIDSREIKPGDIFIAFKGESLDGHDYVADALAKGAACAVVESVPSLLEDTQQLMIVPSTMTALRDLAVFNRSRSNAKILAVTGSVGKTSTKEALLWACSAGGKSYCSRKNFNNELGLPISLASMPLDTEYGIFEVGMNHSGEIAQLTQVLKPHLALITRIAKVHIEYFDSLEAIARAKGEIFLGMGEMGIAILNGDDDYCPLLTELSQNQGLTTICRFGESSSNDSYLIEYKPGELNKIKASIFGNEVSYSIKAIGKHQAINSIAVLSAVTKLGVDLKAAAAALADFSSVDGRGKSSSLEIGGKKIFIIDDSYNANPTSIEASLQTIKEQSCTRKLAVLGDMAELGAYAESAHKELLGPFEASGVDKLITVGPLMKNLYELVAPDKRLHHFDNYKDARDKLLDFIEDGDCMLFKGSNGTKIHEIVKHLKKQTT